MKPLNLIILAGITLLLAACADNVAPPEDRFYRLAPQGQAQPLSRRLPGVVLVDRFTADGVTGGRPILFSRAGATRTIHEYHYHQWALPPGIMLQDRMIEFLRRSGGAATIVKPEMRVAADYTISGRILKLERVVGGAPTVAVSLELGLREEESGRMALVRTYEETLRHNADTVADAVAALNGGIDRIFTRFLTDLVGG